MMLTLMLLLILSSVSLQKNLNSQDGNVLSLSPDLEDKVPAKISVLGSQRFLACSMSMPPFPEGRFSHGTLRWERWTGSLPDGAVFINNEYAERKEYVCKFVCHSGFFSPSKDSGCHVANEGRELVFTYDFDILVNKDDFEILEWKDGYYGSLPENSVRTCAGVDIYVGKNKYGLGKVDLEDKCFYLPWEESEYWYWSYQVLTTNNDIESNLMTNIRHNTDDAKIVSYPPETLSTSVITNHECEEATKSVTLTKIIKQEKSWDVGSSFKVNPKTEEFSLSVTVSHRVPPKHSCRVRMMGHKQKKDIPFTARFKRTYRNGITKSTTISGTYHSIGIGSANAEVDRCTPVPNATPCP